MHELYSLYRMSVRYLRVLSVDFSVDATRRGLVPTVSASQLSGYVRRSGRGRLVGACATSKFSRRLAWTHSIASTLTLADLMRCEGASLSQPPRSNVRCCVLTSRLSFYTNTVGRFRGHGSCISTGARPACSRYGQLNQRCPPTNANGLTWVRCHLPHARCRIRQTLFGTRCRERRGGCHGMRPCGTR